MHYAHDMLKEGAALPNPWGLDRARVVCLISQKGGVGKTTSAINLGAAFALCGHRVLLIGTDPQCGVSRSLGFAPDQLRGGLSDVLMTGLPLEDVTHETPLDGLHMVVPDAWSLDEEIQYKTLMHDSGHTFVAAVGESRKDFDTILIDCPPGFGPETQAALTASDAYLVPVQAEELCRDTLQRLLRFVNEHAVNGTRAVPRLEGLFMTMTDHRTRMSRHVAESLDREYQSDLLDRSIPRNTRLAEMALQGRPTVIYDRLSAGSRAYFDLVDEISLRWLGRTEVEEEEPRPEPCARAAAAGGAVAFSPAPTAPDESQLEPEAANSLSRLLRDLGGGAPAPSPAVGVDWSAEEENAEPEMISLDDLIEEEEGSGRHGEESDDWGFGDDDFGTVN